MILCVCMSPALQRTIVLPGIVVGEVNRANEVFVDASGKGMNVARVLSQLSMPALHLSQGGSNGSTFAELADEVGVQLDLIENENPIRTCVSLVSVRDQGGVANVTEIVEPSSAVSGEVAVELLIRVSARLQHAKALVVSGSLAQGFPIEVVASLTHAAKQAAVPVILDVRGEELLLALKEEPDLVKINLSEYLRTFLPNQISAVEQSELQGDISGLEPLFESLRYLTEDSPTSIVLTRGPRPVIVARDGNVKELAIPRMHASEIVNPIGSGDAFSAGMALIGAIDGFGDDETFDRAVLFGAACGQANARTLRPGQLDMQFLQQRAGHDTILSK